MTKNIKFVYVSSFLIDSSNQTILLIILQSSPKQLIILHKNAPLLCLPEVYFKHRPIESLHRIVGPLDHRPFDFKHQPIIAFLILDVTVGLYAHFLVQQKSIDLTVEFV
jgi:hypothetical protein